MKRLWILTLTGVVLMLLLTLAANPSVLIDAFGRQPLSAARARVGTVPPIRSARPELPARATVSPGDAWRIAERSLADGEPTTGTLRELGGRLAYVLEFRLPPRSRGEVVGEVIVDARSGSVISVHRAGGRAAR